MRNGILSNFQRLEICRTIPIGDVQELCDKPVGLLQLVLQPWTEMRAPLPEHPLEVRCFV